MNRKELEPYVSHDVAGLFNMLAKKRTSKLSKSTLRKRILKVVYDNESSEIQSAQFKRIYEELSVDE